MNTKTVITLVTLLTIIGYTSAYPRFDRPRNIEQITSNEPENIKDILSINLPNLISNVVSELLEDGKIITKLNYDQDKLENLPKDLKELCYNAIRLMVIYKHNRQLTHDHFLYIMKYLIDNRVDSVSQYVNIDNIFDLSLLLDKMLDDLITKDILDKDSIIEFIYTIIDIETYFDILTTDRDQSMDKKIIFDNIFNIYVSYEDIKKTYNM